MNETVIEAGKARIFPDMREAWSRRGLLAAFVRRGLAVRYRQAAIGILWGVLQPAITVAIFTLVFRKMGAFGSDGLPYSVFACIGMTAWIYFSRALTEGSNSLVANHQLVSKSWFPRLLLPASSVIEACVEYAVMLALVIGLCAYHGVVPGLRAFAYPAFVILLMASAFGLGLWFSALNVRYRDIRIVVPFLLQAGLFATPVVWPPSAAPEPWRLLVAANPIAVAIDGMRWSLGGAGSLMTPAGIGIGAGVAAIVLAGGLIHFARAERAFADVI